MADAVSLPLTKVTTIYAQETKNKKEVLRVSFCGETTDSIMLLCFFVVRLNSWHGKQQGADSISHKTSYRKISQRLEDRV